MKSWYTTIEYPGVAVWQCSLNSFQQNPNVVRDIVVPCVCLHNLVPLSYPMEHLADVDKDDEQNNNMSGEWGATLTCKKSFWCWDPTLI